MRHPASTQKGFTLIELLMVIAIIGMLAAIAIPMLMGQRDRAKNTALLSSAGSIASEVVGLVDDYADKAPVLFKLEGGSLLCYEYSLATGAQTCAARYSDAEETRTYSDLGDLLDQAMVSHNDALGEVSPFDASGLVMRTNGTPGHVNIVNSDNTAAYVIVNAVGGGGEIFYQKVKAR